MKDIYIYIYKYENIMVGVARQNIQNNPWLVAVTLALSRL
jgi:hypothetical protein